MYSVLPSCVYFVLIQHFVRFSMSQIPGTRPPTECVSDWNVIGQHSFHHAPPRAVPIPDVDQEIKIQFLQLFRRDIPDYNYNYTTTATLQEPSMDPDTIAKINELCPRDAFFYSFAPRHIEATMMLIKVFMESVSAEVLLQLARNLLNSKEINPRVWFMALQTTIQSRNDTSGYHLAWQLDATPDLYIPATILNAIGEESSRSPSLPVTSECITSIGERKKRSLESSRIKRENFDDCIVYNGTNGATGDENRLWYFREDMMISQHHWYWHLYFPFFSPQPIDRRGEMFYFMHHQIIARYNAERLSNGLERETALDFVLGGNIGHGYDSDLVDKQSGKFWTPRQADKLLADVMHANDPDFLFDITINKIASDYATLFSHVGEGILLVPEATQDGQPPTEVQLDIRNLIGLNYLGDTFEASSDSVNPAIYTELGIHNMAHGIAALQTDPDYTCRLPPGVVGDTVTALRDPAFYKLHTMVEDLFEHYQNTLSPYQLHEGEWPLVWRGVKIQNLEIVSRNNSLKTFWSTKRFPVEQGIDGSIHDGDVQQDICHVHLNHGRFTFNITVDVDPDCVQTSSNQGTIRIFMAPRFNLSGSRFTMNETRKLMFQLDVFPVPISPGRNVITRNSQDSSATKPWSRSLEEMIQDPTNSGKTEYCGCGWPEHLYIPKGTSEGMEFDLFAMITNFDEDQVEDTPDDSSFPEACNSPYLYCGVPHRKYPDKRPMGYPFDRFPYSVSNIPVDNLEDYVANVPNMKSSVITIQHLDTFWSN